MDLDGLGTGFLESWLFLGILNVGRSPNFGFLFVIFSELNRNEIEKDNLRNKFIRTDIETILKFTSSLFVVICQQRYKNLRALLTDFYGIRCEMLLACIHSIIVD